MTTAQTDLAAKIRTMQAMSAVGPYSLNPDMLMRLR